MLTEFNKEIEKHQNLCNVVEWVFLLARRSLKLVKRAANELANALHKAQIYIFANDIIYDK